MTLMSFVLDVRDLKHMLESCCLRQHSLVLFPSGR